MNEKTINEELFKELYTEALAKTGDNKTREAVLSQLFMLVKRELDLTDWPTSNDQDPYGFAIFEIVAKYGKPSFSPYNIWGELRDS